MSEILDLAWFFCKRAKEARMDDERIKCLMDDVLEFFDASGPVPETDSEVFDLACLVCKRAKERGADDKKIRWLLNRALEKFDAFELLTRVSINQIQAEGEE